MKKIIDIVRRFLEGNLSNKLEFYRKYYSRNPRYIFDSQNIYCGITEWTSPNKSYSVYAAAYCNDFNVGGIDTSNHFNFYSKNFKSYEEAYFCLGQEILEASRKHPSAKFYRITPGKKEYCFKGNWYDGSPVHMQYCQGCGHKMDTIDVHFCPQCGEPILE